MASCNNIILKTAEKFLRVRTVERDYYYCQAPVERNLSYFLFNDMKRCSLAMGVSTDKITRDKSKMERIATKASKFLTALREVIPHPSEFLPGEKTPCWYSNLTIPPKIERGIIKSLRLGRSNTKLTAEQVDLSIIFAKTLFESPQAPRNRTLYCLPYFLLPGFRKCATTSLDHIFREHPQIMGPKLKEPQWWARIPLGNMSKNYLKIATVRYLLVFQHLSHHVSQHLGGELIGYDASLSSMSDSNFKENGQEIDYCAQVAVIHRVLPDAKIIVSMREPVSRLFSAYLFFHRNYTTWPKKMKGYPSLNFHTGVTRLVQLFKECLAKWGMSIFECRYYLRDESWNHIKAYVGDGIYHDELKKWMQFYPRGNFLLLESSEMSSNSIETMKRIEDFLLLDPVSNETVKKWFGEKQNFRSSKLLKKKFEMMPATKRMLTEFYAPFNQMLVDLTNDIRFSWT